VKDYFNGKKFFNPWLDPNREKKTFAGLLKARLTNEWSKWPKNVPVDTVKPVARVDSDIKITFVGHSTFLIQTEKLNILTDPVWSKRVSPFSWIGPSRAHDPGIRLEDLPRIDAVLVSHNHYDHLDVDTLRKIHENSSPIVLTGFGNEAFLKSEGIKRVAEMKWWEDFEAEGFRFTYVPSQHFSGRWLDDRNETLWGGFVMHTPGGKKIYFGGDSGYGPFVKDIHAKVGAVDLALIPIGAYEPRDFFKEMHNNPEDAVLTHLDLQAKQSVACHFGTFQLTAEAIDAPPRDLQAALVKHKVSDKAFIVPKVGHEYRF
jgi:L-ascorbate metabolism protein UlaG (beta-lactamase superfamily)